MTTGQATSDGLMGSQDTHAIDWDAVYADHAPRVYNYFRFRMGIEADAADLTSRTFEKAWRSRARYRHDLAGFATWLFTIANNLGIDYLKARRSHLPIDTALCRLDRCAETRGLIPVYQMTWTRPSSGTLMTNIVFPPSPRVLLCRFALVASEPIGCEMPFPTALRDATSPAFLMIFTFSDAGRL